MFLVLAGGAWRVGRHDPHGALRARVDGGRSADGGRASCARGAPASGRRTHRAPETDTPILYLAGFAGLHYARGGGLSEHDRCAMARHRAERPMRTGRLLNNLSLVG